MPLLYAFSVVCTLSYENSRFQVPSDSYLFLVISLLGSINPIPPGLLRVAQLGGEGGGGVPVAFNSKTIKDTGIKFGGVAKDY